MNHDYKFLNALRGWDRIQSRQTFIRDFNLVYRSSRKSLKILLDLQSKDMCHYTG